MKKLVRTGAAALMLTCMAGNVWAAAETAANSCASKRDMTALKAAAVQQKLMVAALSCNAIQVYNDFVRAYQKELQASDRALQNFFRRLNGATGTADYHAFKTRLANSSSMQSIGDMPSYCAGAKETFDTALNGDKKNLEVFVSAQTTSVDNAYEPCPVPVVTARATPAKKAPAKPVTTSAPVQNTVTKAPN